MMSMKEKAQKVWDVADETLKQVDNAHIFSVAQEICRDFPTFDANEITSGPLMGQGGFSNVFEVININLSNDERKKEESCQIHSDKSTTTASKGNHPQATDTIISNSNIHDNIKIDDNNEDHYHIDTARELMSKRCMRFGSARYAIKRLRPDLNQLEYARGALDLAIEIKYMSVLMHPNIVKMRASSNTPRLSLDTFIIMGE
jgi:hypothetical protein